MNSCNYNCTWMLSQLYSSNEFWLWAFWNSSFILLSAYAFDWPWFTAKDHETIWGSLNDLRNYIHLNVILSHSFTEAWDSRRSGTSTSDMPTGYSPCESFRLSRGKWTRKLYHTTWVFDCCKFNMHLPWLGGFPAFSPHRFITICSDPPRVQARNRIISISHAPQLRKMRVMRIRF